MTTAIGIGKTTGCNHVGCIQPTCFFIVEIFDVVMLIKKNQLRHEIPEKLTSESVMEQKSLVTIGFIPARRKKFMTYLLEIRGSMQVLILRQISSCAKPDLSSIS